MHPQCSGINKKEFTKIDKIIKSSKTGNNFFKCLKCSFQSATALGVDLTKIISAGKRKSVDTQTDSSNSLISDTSKTHQTDHTSHQLNSSIESKQKTKTDKEEISSLSKDQTSVDFVCTSKKETNRLIDNIPQEIKPNNSAEIKKRIKDLSSKNINIKHTYTLPKGGIAIHTDSEKDTKILEQEIQHIFPGSYCEKPLCHRDNKKIVIKNIHPSIIKEHIRESFRKQFHQNSFIKRFHSSTTKKPLPIISITCHTETVTKLLKNGLTILQKHYLCEPYKKPVIRCYNCQLFGHILH